PARFVVPSEVEESRSATSKLFRFPPQNLMLGASLGFGAWDLGFSLRPAEQSAVIDVASEPAVRNAAKIIHPTGVRAIIKPGSASIASVRITARRRRSVASRLVLFDGRADQSAGRCAGSSPDGGAA